jgi:transcriptional regulator with XRE-family HTH domain
MDASKALRSLVDASGLTHRQIAHRLGKYDSYVSQILTRSNAPGADTLASIAHACGYHLALVPDGEGETIVIGENFEPTDSSVDDKVQQARALLARACALLDDGR